MLAAVVMCTHFRSYLRGAQFTLRTDHSSLRWLQKFWNSEDMLARWYLLLGQFSVAFEYRPESQHPNPDDLSGQFGQCLRPGCPVSTLEQDTGDADSSLMDRPYASSAMGDSMDAYLLPELSGETWVAATYLEEVIADLPQADSEPDLINASQVDETMITVRKWIQASSAPSWPECSALSPELRCWRLQFGNLPIDTDGRLWRRRALRQRILSWWCFSGSVGS